MIYQALMNMYDEHVPFWISEIAAYSHISTTFFTEMDLILAKQV